jgi:DNA-binding transcriptional LysR family regulator
VLRRVNSFEQRLGLRIFERLPSGYALTAGGEELLAAARAMSQTIVELERRLVGKDLRLEGSLRITTTDTLMASVLPEVLAAFRAENPGITLEVTIANQMANLTKRDADVAIRPTREAPENLVGRRISEVAFALYATPSYITSNASGDHLSKYSWIAPDESLMGTSVARWMRSAIPASAVVFRADSFVVMQQAALAGFAAAPLPCYLGDSSPGLARLRPKPVKEMTTALWVLTHQDLRRTARVSAFTRLAAQALARKRKLFEGSD